jgi:hypothetical protein
MQIPDRPSVRRANLLQLFSDFVLTRMVQSPSQQINGLDREFAALIQVQRIGVSTTCGQVSHHE